jgi:hypothetical protein
MTNFTIELDGDASYSQINFDEVTSDMTSLHIICDGTLTLDDTVKGSGDVTMEAKKIIISRKIHFSAVHKLTLIADEVEVDGYSRGLKLDPDELKILDVSRIPLKSAETLMTASIKVSVRNICEGYGYYEEEDWKERYSLEIYPRDLTFDCTISPNNDGFTDISGVEQFLEEAESIYSRLDDLGDLISNSSFPEGMG